MYTKNIVKSNNIYRTAALVGAALLLVALIAGACASDEPELSATGAAVTTEKTTTTTEPEVVTTETTQAPTTTTVYIPPTTTTTVYIAPPPPPTTPPAPAPPASAATGLPPDSYWDRMAQCETGGNWAHYPDGTWTGGLGIYNQTWLGWGGGEFAPKAGQATREQQIIVANRIATQGYGSLGPVGYSAWGCLPAVGYP
jgi:hypothetical protein